MSFNYDLSTNVGKVRLNIGDTSNSPTTAIFTDEEISSVLTQVSNDINFASGRLLLIIANSKARLAKRKSAGKYSEDTTSIASELREQAKAWFEMANEPYDATAEQTFGSLTDPFEGSEEKQFIERENLRGDI